MGFELVPLQSLKYENTTPGLFFVLFSVYFKRTLLLYNNIMWKKVHLVCSAGIRTHSFLNATHLSSPLDQGSRPWSQQIIEVSEETKQRVDLFSVRFWMIWSSWFYGPWAQADLPSFLWYLFLVAYILCSDMLLLYLSVVPKRILRLLDLCNALYKLNPNWTLTLI